MKSTTAIKPDDEMRPDLDALVDDLAELKRDVATLMNLRKSDARDGTGDSAQSAIGRISDEVASIYEGLAGQGKRSGKAIGRQVEEQPVISLLIAFAVGFCASRLMAR